MKLSTNNSDTKAAENKGMILLQQLKVLFMIYIPTFFTFKEKLHVSFLGETGCFVEAQL